MCGIFGAVCCEGGTFEETDAVSFARATDLVAYRGPDARGEARFRAGTGERAAAGEPFDAYLGHRRLSIIDTSDAGIQPMTTDGRRWIVFNGEIFNYRELAAELERDGCVFRTRTDTEVILRVYERYGERGFDRLNGMWAFALLDLDRHALVLSRDRFSMKPLYVAHVGRRVLFASECKQLLPFLPRRAPDAVSLHRFLKQGLLDTDGRTLFDGITQVPPKHNLVVDLDTGTTAAHAYWRYGTADVPSCETEICEAFGSLLRDAVRLRLRSDVPVGLMVSGGLDSSALSVAVQASGQADVRRFGAVSTDARVSEARHMDELEAGTGVTIERLVLNAGPTWERLRQVVWHNDSPFNALTIVAHEQVIAEIRRTSDVTVILSGQGADELLCGYRKFFFFHVAADLRAGRLAQAAANVAGSALHRTVLAQTALSEAKRYLPLSKGADPLDAVLRDGVEPVPLGAGGALRSRQEADLDRLSVPALAHYEDRNSMAHSTEIRMPFLDHRLVDFALSLPPHMLIRRGWPKYVLRRGAGLPPAIAWRRDKQGFSNPEASWLRHELRPAVTALFADSTLARRGIVDGAGLRRFYERFVGGDRLIWHGDVSRLATAEMWAQAFLD
ncbi:MAG: asparagine synthase (glutamine-hydrolyzing) [Vicinamibacterales bacterium]